MTTCHRFITQLGLEKSWQYNGLDNNQLAGTDAQRAADFQQQLDNPNIKVWCKRVMVRFELLICWILPNLNKAKMDCWI
jgi:hypothetical protein